MKARPTFHIASAAVTRVAKRSPLFFEKSQVPSASCAPVMKRKTPRIARLRRLRGGDRADRLHRLHRHRRAVVNAADQHR